MQTRPGGRTLRLASQPLINLAHAWDWRRMANALRNGAALISAGRCESVDEETIRIYSPSGETYLTSLTNCVNDGTGDECPAWEAAMPCKHRAALHLLVSINRGDEDGAHECSACHRRFHDGRLMPVNMAALRAGEIVPSGVCELCGFYCYPLGRAAAAA